MGFFDIFRRNRSLNLKRDTENSNSGYNYHQEGKTFSLNRYRNNPENLSAFFGGIELISNSIADVPILVKKVGTNVVLDKHPLYDALNYGQMSKFNFIKQLVHDVYVNGNGFAYIERDPEGEVKKLTYCPPGSYTIWVDDSTRKVYYQVPFMTGSRYLDPSSVIHIFKNSKNGLYGLGIADYANIILPLASAADKNALQFYDSGGNINGILQSKRQLDTEMKIDAYNEWTNAFRGGNKNGNIAVLGNDFEYKQVGVSQKDAQQLETRQFNVLEICRYLNINPILLGVNTGSTYNNIEQAQIDLVIHTLLPMIQLIQEEFNRKLIRPSQRGKYFIDFDEDKIMFSDKNSNANYYTNLTKNGLLSINEVRIALGYSPKEGCDDLIIPYTNVNNNKVDGKESEETPKDEEKPKDEAEN